LILHVTVLALEDATSKPEAAISKPTDLFQNRQILDITPTVNSRLAVFPGDVPFREAFSMETKNGDHLTLSSIQTTVHLGAHTDAPNHYASGGQAMDQRDLKYYMGPAQVIDVSKADGPRILTKDLKNIPIQAERVLFKTLSFPDPYKWNDDFKSLSAELIDYLFQNKVKLVGIDTPSIDPAQDKELESHQAVLRHDMAILEGIVLSDVAAGLYQLIALPLKLEGADASPVRAILLR
jgi:arylformamidase